LICHRFLFLVSRAGQKYQFARLPVKHEYRG
jgi:hypothetical protein